MQQKLYIQNDTIKNLKQISHRTRIKFTYFGKIQFFLVPTRTMVKNKLLNKYFKQILNNITDIKQNLVETLFITKFIPSISILNSKLHIKDKYTRTNDTSLTFFQRINKQPPFFLNFTPYTSKDEYTWNHYHIQLLNKSSTSKQYRSK